MTAEQTIAYVLCDCGQRGLDQKTSKQLAQALKLTMEALQNVVSADVEELSGHARRRLDLVKEIFKESTP